MTVVSHSNVTLYNFTLREPHTVHTRFKVEPDQEFQVTLRSSVSFDLGVSFDTLNKISPESPTLISHQTSRRVHIWPLVQHRLKLVINNPREISVTSSLW